MLLVGLGNPGKKYARTRHNAGQIIIDLLNRLDNNLDNSLKGFTLIKTSAFMNNSGVAVKTLLDEQGVGVDKLVIAHDDVDLPLGEFKLQFGRSSAGHKGIESVITALGTKDFWRLRIGVGRPPAGVEVEGWVLSKFTEGELGVLEQVIPKTKYALTKLFEGREQNTKDSF